MKPNVREILFPGGSKSANSTNCLNYEKMCSSRPFSIAMKLAEKMKGLMQVEVSIVYTKDLDQEEVKLMFSIDPFCRDLNSTITMRWIPLYVNSVVSQIINSLIF